MVTNYLSVLVLAKEKDALLLGDQTQFIVGKIGNRQLAWLVNIRKEKGNVK